MLHVPAFFLILLVGVRVARYDTICYDAINMIFWYEYYATR